MVRLTDLQCTKANLILVVAARQQPEHSVKKTDRDSGGKDDNKENLNTEGPIYPKTRKRKLSRSEAEVPLLACKKKKVCLQARKLHLQANNLSREGTSTSKFVM
jgi:hypothetical protein